jgi:hypothetical protein
MTLAWRVPCPAAIGPVPFASLEKLHRAAVAVWPTDDRGSHKPEPLVTYAAALFVSAQQRPELAHVLKAQGASVLHALSFMYARSAPAAAARVAHLAVDTWAVLGVDVPWAPPALVLLLDLQAKVHAQWAEGSEAAHALAIAGLYAAHEKTEEAQIAAHVKAGQAFWTSVALRLSAPPLPTAKERATLAPTYLQGQFDLAERYAEAAAGVLETAARALPTMDAVFAPLLKLAREEALLRRNERLARENNIGAYVTRDLTIASLLDAAEPLPLPAPAAASTADVSGAQFDATMRRAMDAWTATETAASLGRVAPAASPGTMNLNNIMARLLGLKEEDVVRNDRSLRTAEAWRAAILAATHQYEWAYGLGYGGPEREAGMAMVKEAREILRI